MATNTITLTLPVNTWTKPTEVRNEVVQAICNAFINGMRRHTNDWRPFIPYLDMEKQVFADCRDNYFNNPRFVKFYECEMVVAFTALKEVGFYFEKISNINGTWYALREKSYPTSTYGRMVSSFNEEWD